MPTISPQVGGFYSDPKVWIAIFGAVMSLISLVVTAANQWEQNRRWTAINAANVVIADQYFRSYLELPRSTFKKEDFEFSVMGMIDTVHPDNVSIIQGVDIRDAKTGEHLNRVEPKYTRKGIEEQLQRYGMKMSDCTIRFVYKPTFTFVNMGKVDAVNFDVKYEMLAKYVDTPGSSEKKIVFAMSPTTYSDPTFTWIEMGGPPNILPRLPIGVPTRSTFDIITEVTEPTFEGGRFRVTASWDDTVNNTRESRTSYYTHRANNWTLDSH